MIILTEDEKKYVEKLHKVHRRIFEAIAEVPEPTYKAVAEHIGRPIGTVKSRLSRARGIIKRLHAQDQAGLTLAE